MAKYNFMGNKRWGIIPPYMIDKLLDSKDAKIQKIAIRTLKLDSFIRTDRLAVGTDLRAKRDAKRDAGKAPAKQKAREVYNAENQERLPGKLVRKEGKPATQDVAIDEAYDYLGATYDCYKEKCGRNSIDNYGMKLIATVHFGEKYANAFWNGSQMVFGDGDGQVFGRLTLDLDVIGHELAHGVTEFESGLIYQYQSGALNESYSDVFGIMIKQFYQKLTVEQSDWLIGTNCILGEQYALRSMKAPGTAYKDHPVLGSDPQPGTMDTYKKLEPWEDNGGVHINSGIPNYAFYVTAMEIGGYAWEKAGKIWYQALPKLKRDATFADGAKVTIQVAGELFGEDSAEKAAVTKGWKAAKVI